MMSAPSCARRTACDRPCPRAAPVTKATLRSRSPMVISYAQTLEVRKDRPVGDLAEDRAHPQAPASLVRRRAGDRGDQARPLGQLDDGQDVRDLAGERVVRGVPDDGVGVDGADAADLPPDSER